MNNSFLFLRHSSYLAHPLQWYSSSQKKNHKAEYITEYDCSSFIQRNNGLICPIMYTMHVYTNNNKTAFHQWLALFFGVFNYNRVLLKKKHNMGAVLLYWNPLHRSNRQWLGGRIVPYLYILLMHCNRWNPMGREMLHWCTIKSDAKSWAISTFLTSSVKEIFSARMSLSPTSPTSATTTAASAVLTNINRMEGHLLTRFHHIDPELVDEYLSGRRRQVG